MDLFSWFFSPLCSALQRYKKIPELDLLHCLRKFVVSFSIFIITLEIITIKLFPENVTPTRNYRPVQLPSLPIGSLNWGLPMVGACASPKVKVLESCAGNTQSLISFLFLLGLRVKQDSLLYSIWFRFLWVSSCTMPCPSTLPIHLPTPTDLKKKPLSEFRWS